MWEGCQRGLCGSHKLSCHRRRRSPCVVMGATDALHRGWRILTDAMLTNSAPSDYVRGNVFTLRPQPWLAGPDQEKT